MARNKEPHRPSVLVLDEKHGYMYFDALTEDALHRSALSILNGRLKAGIWYTGDREFEDHAKLVVRRKDGREAWRMLEERQDAEYEGVRLEPLVQKYPIYGNSDEVTDE